MTLNTRFEYAGRFEATVGLFRYSKERKIEMNKKFFLVDTKIGKVWTNVIIAAGSLEEAETKVKEMQKSKQNAEQE